TLTVTNDVLVNGQSNNNFQTLNVNAGTLVVGGDLTVSSGSGNRMAAFAVTTGSVNVAGNLSVTGGNTVSAPGATSTFTFNGNSPQTVTDSVGAFGNVVVNNTGSTVTLGTNTSVTGNLTVQSGSLDNGGFSITGAAGKTFQVSA